MNTKQSRLVTDKSALNLSKKELFRQMSYADSASLRGWTAAGRSVGQPLWRKRHLPAFGETPCTHAVSRRFEHLRKVNRLY
ncbi:MAG: hypothetical protein IK990_08455 [Ruminiclostridium sp.]|nr:hypothetical protein [Ruminiclostridium sp.]